MELSIVPVTSESAAVVHLTLSTQLFNHADLEIHSGADSCDVICPDRIVNCADLSSPANPTSLRLGSLAERLVSRAGAAHYRPERHDAITRMRSRLDGELFVDRLFAECGLCGTGSYPPQSTHELQKLLSAIEAAKSDDACKQRLYLYLARDMKAGGDSALLRDQLLSPSDLNETFGYWAMDHGVFEDGVRQLSLVEIPPAAATKVIKVLMGNCRYVDASRYIQAVKPELHTDEDKCLRMALHLKLDMFEALTFQVYFFACVIRQPSRRRT